jgi:hypothetical protein
MITMTVYSMCKPAPREIAGSRIGADNVQRRTETQFARIL